MTREELEKQNAVMKETLQKISATARSTYAARLARQVLRDLSHDRLKTDDQLV